MIFFEAMHHNFAFLCTYLNIDNPIPDLRTIKAKSQEKFKENFGYELFEHDLSENMENFVELNAKIIKEMKSFLHGELSYWESRNPTVYNYVNNLDDEGNYTGF